MLIFPIRVTCHTHPMLLNLIIVETSRRRVQIRPCRSPCYAALSNVPLLPPFRYSCPQLATILTSSVQARYLKSAELLKTQCEFS